MPESLRLRSPYVRFVTRGILEAVLVLVLALALLLRPATALSLPVPPTCELLAVAVLDARARWTATVGSLVGVAAPGG